MSGDSSLGIGIGLALKSYGRGLTYVKTDRALDLGNLEPFTIPDLSGNANTATLYTGIYVSTNGTTDKAINADCSGLGSGAYKLIGKVRSSSTGTKYVQIGSAASFTVASADVWEDFESSVVSGGTPTNVAVGWDGGSNFSACDWSDVKLVNASTNEVLAHYKLYDSADASLDGYPVLDCVGGYHGAHVGCAGGASEASILQTAGEDFNKRMWFDGVNDYVAATVDITGYSQISLESEFIIGDNAGTGHRTISIGHSGTDDVAIGYAGNTGFIFTRVDDGTAIDSVSDSTYSLGDKVHVVMTFDGTTIKSYIDGVLQADTDTGSFNFATASVTTRICEVFAGSAGTDFEGLILKTKVYNSALSQSEVTSALNNTLTTSALKHSWLGNGNTDAAWVDQVGSSDGTVNGSPSLYHVAESETTAGQDALGNAIVNPRPNERVLNLTTGTGYAEIADSASLDLTTEGTWELWGNFYGDTPSSSEALLSKTSFSDNKRTVDIARSATVANNTITFTASSNGLSVTSFSKTYPVANKTSQIVFTYAASTLLCYIDGVLTAQTASNGTVTSSLHANPKPYLTGARPVGGAS